MIYSVYVPYSATSWLAPTRWCEFIVGDLGDGWFQTDGDQGDIYHFYYEVHAEYFRNLFGKTHNGSLIVPYSTYRSFWINRLGRDRLDRVSEEKGWVPQVVIPSDVTLNRRRRLEGGRVYFRRFTGWFFEREQDALMFLLFDFDESHD